MTSTPQGAAWDPPKRLPVFFDVPAAPPPARIRISAGMSPVGLCLAIIRSAGWYAVVGCLLLVIHNGAVTLVPVALGAVVDEGIGALTRGASPVDALPPFLGWIAGIVALYAVIHVTYRFGGRLGWYAVQRARHELASRVVERAVDPRGTAGPARMPGRLLSIATSDTDRACSALYLAIYPLGNIVAIAVATVALFAIHPMLGLLSAVGAPLLLGVMSLIARPLHARIGREQDAMADAAGVAADVVTGAPVLRGIHAQAAASTQYRRVSRAALHRAVAANSAEAAVVGANAVLTGLFAGGVAVTAAVLAFHGEISVGGLIAAAALAQSVLSPLTELIESAATVGALALASARRVLDVLDSEPHSGATGTSPVGSNPQLRISMRARESDIVVAAGDFVAIDPGAIDDEALVAVLTLKIDPDAPSPLTVTLDGVPVAQHEPDALRRTVVVAPHRADLLGATVLDSVRPPFAGAGANTLDALRVARCEDLERALPHGFETVVHDRGRTLSGGQRQRVALARAIALNPAVLVLHDPVNAVDAITESEIAVRVRLARAGRTTLVLSSSPAFHGVADRSVTA